MVTDDVIRGGGGGVRGLMTFVDKGGGGGQKWPENLLRKIWMAPFPEKRINLFNIKKTIILIYLYYFQNSQKFITI